MYICSVNFLLHKCGVVVEELNPHLYILFNDIVKNKVGTCHENKNLVLAQIPTQCPFAYVRRIFGEGGVKIVHDTRMVLAPHHPCTNIIVTHQS
jgi:hypothetical protein